MATLLIGYDTESAAVGEGLARFLGPDVPQYRAALDPDSTRRGVGLLARLHEELDAPCTFFVCGRTLLHALDAIEPLAGSPLFDIQQHTYSHVVFRDVRYRVEDGPEAVLPETPAVALREELRLTSELIRKYLGRDCIGLRTPFGYYRGLRGRPDLLEIVRETGHRFVSSWGRNEQNGNPTPWSAQPFTYADDGFPDLLEIPFQFWLDGIWFDVHGYGEGRAFRRALEGAVDEIAERDLVFATAFHEWCAVEADEEGPGWVRGLIERAMERGVEVSSYADYWAQTAPAGAGGEAAGPASGHLQDRAR